MEMMNKDLANMQVAPFTGAWIEISKLPTAKKFKRWSHPSRVRGLKYVKRHCLYATVPGRTLHGCVDWNKGKRGYTKARRWSHPSRVRGLKYGVAPLFVSRDSWSHPSRVRGLKCLVSNVNASRFRSHPSRVRGLKLPVQLTLYGLILSHPSRVRGLK